MTVETLPRLSRAILRHPEAAARLDLPERAVQFGTGALLRGLVDPAINAANLRGHFNGRVVAIGSTGSGRDRAFAEQDGLYTLVTRGLDGGSPAEHRRIITAVSRALSATDAWADVLACARNPGIRLVFSNTTEVGFTLDARDAFDDSPPRSFPAKLTRWLYERATTFHFDVAHGMIVVPCELIERNGDTLRGLVQQVAAGWSLDGRFARWLDTAVTWCNTLVDRIVPGTPMPDDAAMLTAEMGFTDTLLTVAEHLQQFIIEGDAALAEQLGFVDPPAGIIVVPDVEPYRLRKVGLLNGAHTLVVSTALLCGCVTVRDAMQHPQVGRFVRRAVLDDMLPTFDVPDADAFAHAVLERFDNPFIRHVLIDITLHGTTKFRVRLVPTLQRAAARWGQVPESLAFGLAAHLWYLRGDLQHERRAAGLPVPPDVVGAQVTAWWASAPANAKLSVLVMQMLSDETIWGIDLTTLPGLVDRVIRHLQQISTRGVPAALEALFPMEVA